MDFICDAHISYKLKSFLIQMGHKATHINEVLNGSATTDIAICSYSDKNNLILITKDSDFIDLYHIRKSPKKLIKINLGNLSTPELIQLFSDALPFIERANLKERFLFEIDRDQFYLTDDN